jgi:hypothetical protein
MVSDSYRDQTVMFGGALDADGSALSETWLWNGTTWQSAGGGKAAPSARWNAQMSYDSARHVAVLYGGFVGPNWNGADSDTWEWDGSSWSEVATTGPPPIYEGAMAYNPDQGKTVLFGGCSGTLQTCATNETWEWDGTTWVQRHPQHSPSPRYGTQLAHDPVNGGLLLFGGGTGGFASDTWHWDGNDWTHLSPATSPPGRLWYMMSTDERQQRVALFGGQGAHGVLGDAWSWDGTNWRREPSKGPAPRILAAMAAAPNDKTVLFGGPDPTADSQTWTVTVCC